jgi:hypothetical protein
MSSDYQLEDTIYLPFTTRAFATGIPTALVSGVVDIYEDVTATPIITAETLTVSLNGHAGFNMITVTATAATGFGAGQSYTAILDAGTVDSVSVISEVVAHFTLDMSAAAKDLANGSDGLGAIKAETATIVTDTNEIQGKLPTNKFMGSSDGADDDGTLNTISTNVSNVETDTQDIQGRLPAALSSGNMKTDVLAISGDTTAADNLELQYDTTGLTGDTFPATQSQVGNIGSSSGGSLSFQVEIDNAITDTIDNAAAVDKGSGLVGIPVTSHAFTADFEVTIAGSTNYNNAYTIVSETANEIVITETYAAETFGGTETIISTIKTIGKVGTEAGTFANTEAQDSSYHVLTNDGDNLDWVYQIDVGGGRTASLIKFNGYLTGNTDTVNIQAYDFVGSDWETRAVLQGTAQTTDQTLSISLLSKHTGISGADLGKALIRFVDATAAGHVLGINELLIEAVGIGQTVGYANGRIWIDTVNGIAGTEPYVNGLADNRTDLLASAKTLSAPGAVGLTDFHVTNGSTITLAESTVMESYFGDNWTLALGGQDVDGAYFQGAHVTGVGTSATEVHYEGCDIGTMSVQIGHFDFCAFGGTVTQTLAGDYEYHNCYSNVAGSGAPTFTKTAGQVITAEWRNWMDSITVSGLQSGDTITINGRLGTVTLNGADATVEIRGSYKSIVNNLTGSPTVNIDGAWQGSDIADTLTDTTEIGTAGAGLTDITLNAASIDLVYDEPLSGHQTQGTGGAALTMTAYAGPHGPGVYLDDGVANTGTTLGDDGTVENPVSTIAAATTIASNLGVQTFYLINDTVITLAQPYEGYTFIGLGVSNKITLGSSDVDNSEFHNLILTGTQGGTGQMHTIGCSLTALVSAEIIAHDCWLIGNTTLRAATTHIFKACCSAVAGASTPDLTFPGSGTTEVSFRHYSGGLTVKSATTNDTMSFEADGQLIIDSTCTSLTVSVRGNCQITDNGTTTSLIQEAAINLTNINAEMDTALNTAIPGGSTADSINERIVAIDDLTQAAGGGDLAAILGDTNELQTDDVPGLIAALNDVSVADVLTTQMTEAYAADGAAPTVAQALMMIQQLLGEFAISGTTLTMKKVDGATTAATFTLDDTTNPTSLTRAT